MTRNNKMVLGVAAGVAALAVAGVYAKRKGYLDNVNTSNLKDKLSGLKDTAMKALGKENGASTNSFSSSNSMSGNDSMPSSNSTNGASTKRKSSTSAGMSSGSTGINPATT